MSGHSAKDLRENILFNVLAGLAHVGCKIKVLKEDDAKMEYEYKINADIFGYKICPCFAGPCRYTYDEDEPRWKDRLYHEVAKYILEGDKNVFLNIVLVVNNKDEANAAIEYIQGCDQETFPIGVYVYAYKEKALLLAS